MSPFVPFVVALAATAGLALLAPVLGWIDRREGAEERKPRTAPVPLVGGAAILAGFVAAAATGGAQGLAWPALIAAFVVGLVDDVRPGGLSARAKLGGQALVALLVMIEPGDAWGAVTFFDRVGLGVLAVVAMNAVNTFDHQDGLAGTLAVLALMSGAPALAAAVAGYLPLNTVLRRRAADGEDAPVAMMGDSGSHLLGVALVTVPGAAWLLLVPLLDLARVSIARIRRGQPFWTGDRTHLGHRLAAIGFRPVGVAVIVGAVVLPPVVVSGLADGTTATIVGLTLSGLAYLLAIHATRGVADELVPPPPPAPEVRPERPEDAPTERTVEIPRAGRRMPEEDPGSGDASPAAGPFAVTTSDGPAGPSAPPRQEPEYGDPEHQDAGDARGAGPQEEPNEPEPVAQDEPARHPLTGRPSAPRRAGGPFFDPGRAS